MGESKKIAIAGATGRVGSHLVDVLRQRGHDVVPMSRSTGVDVISGDGLDEALSGAEVIVDVATGPSPDRDVAAEFFTTAAGNLHEAGERAGVKRMVVVSIIGADRYSDGYNAAKVAHEQAALSGPIPAQILRAAQFHEFVELLMQWGRREDAIYLPDMRTQLVAARTVAEALADLATASASAPADGPIPEIAGPREERLIEIARLVNQRRGDPTPVQAYSDAAGPDAGLDEGGALLPSPHATLAGPTFEEWLESRS